MVVNKTVIGEVSKRRFGSWGTGRSRDNGKCISFVFSSITWIVKKCGPDKVERIKTAKKDERVVADYGIYRNAI